MVKATIIKLSNYKKNIMGKLIGTISDKSKDIKKHLITQARSRIMKLLKSLLELNLKQLIYSFTE